MESYITSRVIFIVLIMLHCFITMIGAKTKVYVPAKLYKWLFALEVLAVTAFVVYGCVKEPFYDGIALAVLGYLVIYFVIFLSYISLKHWTINPNTAYEFMPEHILVLQSGTTVIDGYICEAGSRFRIYVDDPDYIAGVKKEITLVKYREIIGFRMFFNLI